MLVSNINYSSSMSYIRTVPLSNPNSYEVPKGIISYLKLLYSQANQVTLNGVPISGGTTSSSAVACNITLKEGDVLSLPNVGTYCVIEEYLEV